MSEKLIAYGDKQFFILDIESQTGKTNSIQPELFEQIYNLNYMTNFKGLNKDKCIMACKSTNKLQIVIFDYLDFGSEYNEKHPENK